MLPPYTRAREGEARQLGRGPKTPTAGLLSEQLPSLVKVVCRYSTNHVQRGFFMEQRAENLSSSASVWVQPTLEFIGVSLECTAYAAARDLED